MKKTYYYSDLLNDDFSKFKIKTIKTPESYKYIHKSIIYKFFSFVLYNLIAKPFAILYVKIVFLQRFKNKKALKGYKNKGYFIYGNHTNTIGDAFIPNLINLKKTNHIIVSPDAISIKFIKHIVPMLNGMPIPSGIKSAKNYKKAIEELINNNNSITIYPEAHLWPYYSDIRPFLDISFKYPYELDAPVFTFTNVYVKRKFIKLPKIITYIDGPFFIDKSLERNESIKKLRDEVYEAMIKSNRKHPKYEYIRYIDTKNSENE